MKERNRQANKKKRKNIAISLFLMAKELRKEEELYLILLHAITYQKASADYYTFLFCFFWLFMVHFLCCL